jgi:hypothetical protein
VTAPVATPFTSVVLRMHWVKFAELIDHVSPAGSDPVTAAQLDSVPLPPLVLMTM